MMTIVECLAKADQLNRIATGCGSESDRQAYAETASGWKRVADMAEKEEAWQTLHPRG